MDFPFLFIYQEVIQLNINLIKYNKQLIMNFCNDKKIIISNIEDIFDNIKIEIGEKSDSPYAYIDQDDPFKIIISEDIPMEDRYKWLNQQKYFLKNLQFFLSFGLLFWYNYSQDDTLLFYLVLSP